MGGAHDIGRTGEALARIFYEALGYRCLAANYRMPGGEIDLVVIRGRTLVFVEVKTRGQGAVSSPEEAVTPRKLHLLRRSVRAYLHRESPPPWSVLRIDMVAVENRGEGAGLVLRHHPGIG